MSGNVLVWTLSPWVDSYAQEDLENVNRNDSKEGRRVARGGAFFSPSRYVRCAFRDWYDPVVQYVSVGFRVVAAPFSSGF
ncbi:MAG TPA: SUMF1/EgtB/PvdO family nonheme iron enzyme, partial [Thermoanaerobaculia bacterium]